MHRILHRDSVRRGLYPLLFLVLNSGLTAQNPAPISASAAATYNGPGAAFQFNSDDLRLLDEANRLDAAFEQKGLVLHDPGVQAYIDSVGARILAYRPVPANVRFRLFVLRDPAINAMSLPNGSVYINTGLLAVLENEAQLASIVSHETAHVYDRHPYLENRSAGEKSLAIQIISAAANGFSGGYWLAAVAGSKIGAVLLKESIYGYSRQMEREADRDGLAAMAAAGYDPRAMAAALKLIDQDSNLEYRSRPGFYADHPKNQDREQAAEAYAETNTPPGARTGSEQDYLAAMAPAIADNVQSDLETRRLRSAVAAAARLVNAFPSVPQYQMLLGESYRDLGAETPQPTQEELTEKGENQQRKLSTRLTEQQEQQRLLDMPGGRATLQHNQAAAEKAFLMAIEERPGDALAYRELGFLYEDEGRDADAAENYRHYLKLVANTSLDRYRIERRLAAIESRQTAASH